jgi:hypothetical protein
MKTYLAISMVGIGLLVSLPVLAHPGNTASDGSHYCRTNCDYWGVPWNERHFHGGYTLVTTTTTSTPDSTPIPKVTPQTASVKKPVVPASVSSKTIANKDVPAVVDRLFRSTYNRKPKVSESTYWKNRARTDKKTEAALKGAMQDHKARGVKH